MVEVKMAHLEPDDPRRTTDYIDRTDDSWGWAPILLGVAFAAMLGFLVFGTTSTQPDRANQRTEAPTSPPSAPAMPKQPPQ
jgi:hypothetical protein